MGVGEQSRAALSASRMPDAIQKASIMLAFRSQLDQKTHGSAPHATLRPCAIWLRCQPLIASVSPPHPVWGKHRPLTCAQGEAGLQYNKMKRNTVHPALARKLASFIAGPLLSLACSDAGHDVVNETDDSSSHTSHSSLAADLKLVALSQEQVSALCRWTEAAAPSRSITCDDGSTIIERGVNAARCEDELLLLTDGCAASVADHEKCATLSDCEAERRTNYCARLEACWSK